MSFLRQQWIWLKQGWTPTQWKIIRLLLFCIVLMLLVDGIACTCWIGKIWENESLKDEVARLQFSLKYDHDRQQFEQNLKKKGQP